MSTRPSRPAPDVAIPSRAAADALTIPVAGLLAEPAGTVRDEEIRPVWVDAGEETALSEPISGTVRLARTNRGLLVDASLRTALATECSRCLRDIVIPLDLRIEEEALPSVELTTGLPVDTATEPDVVRLTDAHELELLPLVRDAIWLAQPIAPVCREDCPGLCVECGQPLDEGDHDHGAPEIDPRFEALRGFTVDADADPE
ncbi:MAG TPA: DUF177 domain-containing protein [Candidatus Limnocylindrales bacterium]